MLKSTITRRGFSYGLLAVPVFAGSGWAQASLPTMKVSKDPDCGCCGGWIDYLRKAGMTVDVTETKDLDKVRKRLGVPDDLASCHTAEIGGYVIEGHIENLELPNRSIVGSWSSNHGRGAFTASRQ